MRRALLFGCALLLQLAVAGAAGAITIVDTGPGPSEGGWDLLDRQFLAAEFSIGAAHTVNRVQGWMIAGEGGTGTGTAAIYTDGGEIPGTELFSEAFSVPQVEVEGAGWYGPSGLNWSLLAGTYWVAFEVRGEQTLNTVMPSPSLSPLESEAFTLFGTWNESDSLDIGVRIFADEARVPQPAALNLLVSGLAAMGIAAWRRHRR